jgi:TatA/E family protein of Tat protein translocase
MFGLSLAEVAVILTVALIVFGPDKLPGLARSLAKAYGRLLKLKAEFAKAVEDNVAPLDPAEWPLEPPPGPKPPAGAPPGDHDDGQAK